ncbi:MAG: 16S rRNA processing protein RimM [Fibrobacteraceae bacterium]|nr:16S rRNA processing protein RimM [Fibrobacteraceae bacterium]
MDFQNDFISVCQLMGTHGVKGFIKAFPLTHDLSRHEKLSQVSVQKVNGQVLELEVEQSRLAGSIWLLKFKGLDNPEAVKMLVNGYVGVPETERLPAPEGMYYFSDLEGYRVLVKELGTPGNEQKNENQTIHVGTVLEVMELPTINAFHIEFLKEFHKEYSSKTVLAPWHDDCVIEVNEGEKAIVCHAEYLKNLCPDK